MSPVLVERFCRLPEDTVRDLEICIRQGGLSNRALQGVLKVARTIADLEGRSTIESEDVEEALRFRRSGEDPYDVLSLSDQISIPGMPFK
jgi:magnesium chelatase family protein